MARYRMDLILLQREYDHLQRQYQQQNTTHIQLQANYCTVQQQYTHLQYQYNLLQYQHHQSIVFTRQLRKFYYRILHKVLCSGTATTTTSSSTNTTSSPSSTTTTNRCNEHFHTLIGNCSFGAPNLQQLCDIDQYMLDCGLLYNANEIGNDIKTLEMTSTTTTTALDPTKWHHEIERIETIVASDLEPSPFTVPPSPIQNVTVLDLIPPKSTSAVKFVPDESNELVEVRQKYFQTPGGKCITKQEESMESELHKSYELSFQLHQALVKEQLHVDTLMGTITSDKIEKVFDMMRYQQEIQRYQKIIKDKEYDMKAIIYKMNEIHMISQMYQKQILDQKAYIQQIEQQYQTVQQSFETSTIQYATQIQQLQQSYVTAQEQLNILIRPIWQYHYSSCTTTSSGTTNHAVLSNGNMKTSSEPLPMPCRFIIPFRPYPIDDLNIDIADGENEQVQTDIIMSLQKCMERVMQSCPDNDNEVKQSCWYTDR